MVGIGFAGFGKDSQTAKALSGKVDAKYVTAQYNMKYKVLLNKIRLAQNRLNQLIKNGGGTILSTTKNQTAINNKLVYLSNSSLYNTYEQNLEAKLDFIEFKIKLVLDSAVDQAKQQQEVTEKEKEKIKDCQIYETPLTEAYNNAGNDSADGSSNIQVKRKALQDKKKMFQDQINEIVVYEYDDNGVLKVGPDGSSIVDDAATASMRKSYSEKLEFAYSRVDQAVKQAEDLAKLKAEKVLKACKKTLEFPSQIDMADIKRKAEEALAKASKAIAKLPEDIVKQFQQLESFLQQLISGFGDFAILQMDGAIDLNMMIDNLIAQLQTMVDPVFTTAMSLKLPLPPVAQPIVDLLTMAKTMGKDPPNLTEEAKKKLEELKKQKISIPQDWKDSINNLIETITTLSYMFPVCLIQLIFNMIDAIIGLLTSLGLPVPYPLNLVPQAIKLMPKLIQLMWCLGPALKQIINQKLKDLAAQVMVLGTSVSSAIDNMIAPTPQCPEAVKKELKDQIEKERKARKDAAKLKEAEIKEKKEAALLKKVNEKATLDSAYKNSAQYKKDVENAKKQSEILAQIEGSKLQSLADRENAENTKLQNEFYEEAVKIKPNNTDLIQTDLQNVPDSELNEYELRQKYGYA